jgi:hypothetical protein
MSYNRLILNGVGTGVVNMVTTVKLSINARNMSYYEYYFKK